MFEQIDQQTNAKPHAKENECRHHIMEENTNWYADHNRDEEDT